ncbi:hypothetical protein OHS33_39355 (plasmid) [Streptomyces sp. NBC_00536]|uniref:hypothetical protein n=1 Tax=Streptomyces sp. NBC_00536 TaxID=2975769 RepID=UPI002E809C5E|nr:hypothetical protein [Streptomyces sp. NBC_00536]WUC84513.1 hypothetical protein OHS33_39355 [Streptomyces sp. NBC_00536]
MITARLNRIVAAGTDHGFVTIKLADCLTLNVKTEPDTAIVEEVYLAPGITAPDIEAWENEDDLELFLNNETCGGTIYLDVPVEAVRDLIQDHGGEHDDQDNGLPDARFQINARGDDGQWAVTVEGEQAGRIFLAGETWYAQANGANTPIECDGAEAAAMYLVELADVAAGRVTTAEQDLRAELADHGITPHRDEDTLIGGHRNSWLIIGPHDGEFPNMEEQPYILAHLHNPADSDEVTVDRPIRPADEWMTVVGPGNPSEWREVMGTCFPATATASLAAYIADWRRDPRAISEKALTEARTGSAEILNAPETPSA